MLQSNSWALGDAFSAKKSNLRVYMNTLLRFGMSLSIQFRVLFVYVRWSKCDQTQYIQDAIIARDTSTHK